MFSHLYIDVCPPSLQSPDLAEVAEAGMVQPLRPIPVHLRLGNHPERTGPLPSWAEDLAGRPTVYATLGTIFNNAPGVYQALLDGLVDSDLNVVMAIGSNGDAALLERQTATVHVDRFVAQSLLLARCDLVVCHGGAGTMLAALGAGLPLLLLPVGLDQFHNARCCAQAGVGRWLPAAEVTAAAIGPEVRGLLHDLEIRRRAQGVQQEIEAMPGPEAVVRRIEGLVADHR
jgi:MGT family glycosyltransferase